MNYLTLIMPVFCCFITVYGLIKKTDVFSSFVSGSKEAVMLVFKILPYIVGMVFAVDLFKASGLFSLISSLIGEPLKKIGCPVELVPVMLMRPFSGGASIGLLSGILLEYGADSYIGRVASIYLGSTETLLYTVSLYLGSVGIKKSRFIIPVGILCDVLGMIVSCVLVKLLF